MSLIAARAAPPPLCFIHYLEVIMTKYRNVTTGMVVENNTGALDGEARWKRLSDAEIAELDTAAAAKKAEKEAADKAAADKEAVDKAAADKAEADKAAAAKKAPAAKSGDKA